MTSVPGRFEYGVIRPMLKRVLERRNRSQDAGDAVETGLRASETFYDIASSFIHGSQGAFYDLFDQDANTGAWQLHCRSLRLTETALLHETVFYLILILFAESIHRQKDLGADMYWRELDLISGEQP
jgi:hypothetical protein